MKKIFLFVFCLSLILLSFSCSKSDLKINSDFEFTNPVLYNAYYGGDCLKVTVKNNLSFKVRKIIFYAYFKDGTTIKLKTIMGYEDPTGLGVLKNEEVLVGDDPTEEGGFLTPLTIAEASKFPITYEVLQYESYENGSWIINK